MWPGRTRSVLFRLRFRQLCPTLFTCFIGRWIKDIALGAFGHQLSKGWGSETHFLIPPLLLRFSFDTLYIVIYCIFRARFAKALVGLF
ncbi:hypothetical protein HMPREF0322_04919 [Desulfitobacterium hafniense DP7]|uniref:Uncharacterized protein n=1 Tax=Desulfitobacterium hafniense DP7 TaxID=537010 RepID=G9XVA6_DESHA|nr:hypothetical protein HMPREF0322_04919 [Desulfitobacterium hafniense DP7]